MTPTVPRGSSPRSTETPVQADAGVPAAAPVRPTVAPLRLSLETSYSFVGQSGFPLRGGIVGTYRFDRLFGLGIHFDTNFTDHLSATIRGEGIWPVHRYFQLQGAVELGVRGFMGQPFIDAMQDTHRLDGALFQIGGEVAASIPFSDYLGVSIFLSGRYSPRGGLSTANPQPGMPSIGIGVEGGEVLLGLRLDIYPPVQPHRSEPRPDEAPAPAVTEAAAAPTSRQALQDLRASVDSLLTSSSTATPVAPASAGDAGTVRPATSGDAGTADGGDAAAPADAGLSAESRERILALQREIQSLTDSSDALETELSAATQLLNDLSDGQEAVGQIHVRLDELYEGLNSRPARLDLTELSSFLQEFNELVRDSGPVRLLIQSPTEPFGEIVLSNLGDFRTALLAYQRHLPRSSASGTTRAELEPALSQLGALIAQLQQLRSQPQTTQPPEHQLRLWQTRLERIRNHIAELAPQLAPAAADRLRQNFERLEQSHSVLSQTMQTAQRNWLTSRALYSYYRDFRDARRPEQAEVALRGILTELRGSDGSYRRLRGRNIATLEHVSSFFVNRESEHPTPAWSAARSLAIEVLTWIDSSYRAPELAEPTRRRGGRR